ncbi:hypothetical protein LCGC14_0298250 [marine sediment metagenome]|uniref:Uncharacterized protein n=1 Tax=marine sediment metagenome TaxID=412755 RepID=A0A0F9TR96_9ZZZZ
MSTGMFQPCIHCGKRTFEITTLNGEGPLCRACQEDYHEAYMQRMRNHREGRMSKRPICICCGQETDKHHSGLGFSYKTHWVNGKGPYCESCSEHIACVRAPKRTVEDELQHFLTYVREYFRNDYAKDSDG